MKRARVEHGKRLGDVVAVAGDQLRQATSPRAYLATLLRANTDFAFLARRQRTEARHKADATAQAAELAALKGRLAGRVFYDRDAGLRYEISTTGAELFIRDPQEGAPRVAPTGWIAGMAKGLRGAALVPATPALDARFAERLEAGLANRGVAGAVASWPAESDTATGDTMAPGRATGLRQTAALLQALPARRERTATVAAHLAALRRHLH